MPKLELERDKLDPKDDWEGNNAAFTCPVCKWVFLVSGRLHKHGKECRNPECGKSKGFVVGGKKSKGRAWIEW